MSNKEELNSFDNYYVLDTSAIIDGRIVSLVKDDVIKGIIIIPKEAISELEHQANTKREIGFAGLKVVKDLIALQGAKNIKVEFEGSKPMRSQIQKAKEGEIDALIRDLALEINATLITCDRVQKEVAKILGINVIYLEPLDNEKRDLPFIHYFDSYTQSVHLKEYCKPMAKKGFPGNVKLMEIDNKELSPKELRNLGSMIIELAKQDYNSFIERDAEGHSIIQLREYRIIITKPPMSDGYEITIVKPLIKKNLNEYNISKELMNRIDSKAEGILICGSPGMGKSTFACALAEYYSKKNKIVKTIESPRDLQVGKEITQYGLNEDSYDAISDIILLARPDYCIFDELRKTKDFEIFTDLRLAGIGLIGVVHATEPIDAIQRFIGRVDLGMIPQIIDTIIYIHSGEIKKVYYLNYTVKIPSGMFEKDLARPVIEVINAENKNIEYEIYTFGEETVVIPTNKSTSNFEQKLKSLERSLEKLLKKNFHIELDNNILKLYVSKKDRHKVLGKKGSTINELEKIIGMRIEVISDD